MIAKFGNIKIQMKAEINLLNAFWMQNMVLESGKLDHEPNTIKLRNMAIEPLNNWNVNVYEKFSLCSLSHKSR